MGMWKGSLRPFPPENWACRHWTALPGDPVPSGACGKHSTRRRRRRLLEKPSWPQASSPHLCSSAVWFSFVRREGHYL